MKIGSRVELPPHLDEWAQGDRYGYTTDEFLSPNGHGEVVPYSIVRLDKSGRLVKTPSASLREV